MNKTLLNIDWLTIYCESDVWSSVIKSDEIEFNEEYDKEGLFADRSKHENTMADLLQWGTSSFDIIPMPYGTKQFAKCFNVYQRGINDPLATISCCPRAGILNPKAVMIKFANNILYDIHIMETINQALNELKITPKSISRLDIALDFYEFENNYQPQQLILDFLNGTIKHVGQSIGRVYFVQKKDGITYTGLQFGSKTSAANIYMYNKTHELTEARSEGHHDKPHIRQAWKLGGLNEEGRDVWRIEISFKPEALIFADKTSGEIKDYTKWQDIEQAQIIFGTFFNKLFKFVYPTDPNISRCEKVILFNNIPAIDRKAISVKKCSTMSDKIFIKSLLTSAAKYKDIRDNKDLYECAAKLAGAVINSCDLGWWYNKRGVKMDIPKELQNTKVLSQWLEHKKNEEILNNGYLPLK